MATATPQQVKAHAAQQVAQREASRWRNFQKAIFCWGLMSREDLQAAITKAAEFAKTDADHRTLKAMRERLVWLNHTQT